MTCKELFAKIGCPIPEGCRFYVGALAMEGEVALGFRVQQDPELKSRMDKPVFLNTICRNLKGDFYKFTGEEWGLTNLDGKMEEVGPDFTDRPCSHYFGFDENFDKFYEVYCLFPAVMATV